MTVISGETSHHQDAKDGRIGCFLSWAQLQSKTLVSRGGGILYLLLFEDPSDLAGLEKGCLKRSHPLKPKEAQSHSSPFSPGQRKGGNGHGRNDFPLNISQVE